MEKEVNRYHFIHEQNDIKIHIKTRGHADIEYHGRTARFFIAIPLKIKVFSKFWNKKTGNF